MTKLEEVARAWNAEYARWSKTRDLSLGWCIDLDRVTIEVVGPGESTAEDALVRLRDAACARAAVEALREDGDVVCIWNDELDAILMETPACGDAAEGG